MEKGDGYGEVLSLIWFFHSPAFEPGTPELSYDNYHADQECQLSLIW